MDDEGDDDPLLNLFDSGTQVDEVAQNLDSYGDMPPYGYGTTDFEYWRVLSGVY